MAGEVSSPSRRERDTVPTPSISNKNDNSDFEESLNSNNLAEEPSLTNVIHGRGNHDDGRQSFPNTECHESMDVDAEYTVPLAPDAGLDKPDLAIVSKYCTDDWMTSSDDESADEISLDFSRYQQTPFRHHGETKLSRPPAVVPFDLVDAMSDGPSNNGEGDGSVVFGDESDYAHSDGEISSISSRSVAAFRRTRRGAIGDTDDDSDWEDMNDDENEEINDDDEGLGFDESKRYRGKLQGYWKPDHDDEDDGIILFRGMELTIPVTVPDDRERQKIPDKQIAALLNKLAVNSLVGKDTVNDDSSNTAIDGELDTDAMKATAGPHEKIHSPRKHRTSPSNAPRARRKKGNKDRSRIKVADDQPSSNTSVKSFESNDVLWKNAPPDEATGFMDHEAISVDLKWMQQTLRDTLNGARGILHDKVEPVGGEPVASTSDSNPLSQEEANALLSPASLMSQESNLQPFVPFSSRTNDVASVVQPPFYSKTDTGSMRREESTTNGSFADDQSTTAASEELQMGRTFDPSPLFVSNVEKIARLIDKSELPSKRSKKTNRKRLQQEAAELDQSGNNGNPSLAAFLSHESTNSESFIRNQTESSRSGCGTSTDPGERTEKISAVIGTSDALNENTVCSTGRGKDDDCSVVSEDSRDSILDLDVKRTTRKKKKKSSAKKKKKKLRPKKRGRKADYQLPESEVGQKDHVTNSFLKFEVDDRIDAVFNNRELLYSEIDKRQAIWNAILKLDEEAEPGKPKPTLVQSKAYAQNRRSRSPSKRASRQRSRSPSRARQRGASQSKSRDYARSRSKSKDRSSGEKMVAAGKRGKKQRVASVGMTKKSTKIENGLSTIENENSNSTKESYLSGAAESAGNELSPSNFATIKNGVSLTRKRSNSSNDSRIGITPRNNAIIAHSSPRSVKSPAQLIPRFRALKRFQRKESLSNLIDGNTLRNNQEGLLALSQDATNVDAVSSGTRSRSGGPKRRSSPKREEDFKQKTSTGLRRKFSKAKSDEFDVGVSSPSDKRSVSSVKSASAKAVSPINKSPASSSTIGSDIEKVLKRNGVGTNASSLIFDSPTPGASTSTAKSRKAAKKRPASLDKEKKTPLLADDTRMSPQSTKGDFSIDSTPRTTKSSSRKGTRKQQVIPPIVPNLDDVGRGDDDPNRLTDNRQLLRTRIKETKQALEQTQLIAKEEIVYMKQEAEHQRLSLLGHLEEMGASDNPAEALRFVNRTRVATLHAEGKDLRKEIRGLERDISDEVGQTHRLIEESKIIQDKTQATVKVIQGAERDHARHTSSLESLRHEHNVVSSLLHSVERANREAQNQEFMGNMVPSTLREAEYLQLDQKLRRPNRK